MNSETLYLRLPLPVQNALCSLQGWRIKSTRFSGNFPNFLRQNQERTYWSKEQIREYRDAQISQFVGYCAENVPFYRDQLRNLGVDARQVRGLEDLKLLPLLPKSTVQKDIQLFRPDHPPRQRIAAHTSGTTGGGLRFQTTLEAVQRQWAVWWRYRSWHGLSPDLWCGYFGGRALVPVSQKIAPFWRYNHPLRQIMFSAYHLSESNIPAYLSELRDKRPPWLHGYPSVLSLLAAYIIDHKYQLGYDVGWITTGAENLLSQQAELIEKAFGVRPRQHYGMAEAVANISECERGSLHVDEDFAGVEFIFDDQANNWKIVGSNFTNPATPLLRYEVGDVVTLANHECSCGRPGRTVTAIDGRQEDYVTLANGSRIGRLDHLFKDMVNIREAQIVQHSPGTVCVRIVRGNLYSARDELELKKEFEKWLGVDTVVSFDYVEELERSRTGKLRFVVSAVK